MPTKRARVAAFAIAAVFAAVFTIDLCNFMYRCGCTHVWAGADRHCNIHDPEPPNCPWCAIGASGYAGVMAIIVGGQAAVTLPARWRLGFWPRLSLGILAFGGIGAALAVIIGRMMGYRS